MPRSDDIAAPAPAADSDLEPLLTVKQVAAFLAVSDKHIYALVERRALPHFKISNRVSFARHDLLTWLQENRVSAMESSS